MTREELIDKICPENNKYNCDDKRCEDCDELLNEWLDEYDRQIRAEAIEEIISKAHCEDADCFECPFGTAEKCLLGKW